MFWARAFIGRPSALKVVPFLMCVAVASCGGKKATEEEQTEEAEVLVCETTDDCGDGMICLAGECASTAGGAIYTDTANAITPAKVQAELEAIQKRRQKRHDELLKDL